MSTSLPNNNFIDLRSERGFTLVEMAVVLVIIGLIIGSVFVGQNLIKTAETRAIISSIDKLNIANNLFKDKFNAIAGDYVKATTYIDANALNGDGNGFLTSVEDEHPLVKASTGPTDTASMTPEKKAAAELKDASFYNTTVTANFNEIVSYFNHLSYAGFVDGKYTHDAGSELDKNFPSLKNGKGGIIAYGSYLDLANYYHLGLTSAPAGKVATRNVLTPDTAYSIDLKMDDGLPNTGHVLARGGNNLEVAPSFGTLGAPDKCTVGTGVKGDTYNTENTASTTCQLQIKFGS